MHDFKKFPELSNRQMALYYWDSPHKQITESFSARVIKVTDGDTIRVRADFRDFDFPVRFKNTNAPEKDQVGFRKSKDWLTEKILGEEIHINIDPNRRIGRWGRIIGEIIHMGQNINQMSMDEGMSVYFWEVSSEIPLIEEILR